ncbi:MAG: adenylyltransferase/cytidyltransferase family protein [Chlamydiia bacterium]|nr:adenylyltransferase/cytidyltransferase family protein [Chlamydiia bacterium]
MIHSNDYKQYPPDQLPLLVEKLKAENKKIVTLNGSFDLLHAGHLYILKKAKQQGDALIVALNTDASIKRYKGPHRPIISLNYRLEMMAALEMVDYVTWFDQDDPRELLKMIKPHIHVNGSEYGAECIESEVVKKGGGSIYIVEKIKGLSTSAILEKINRDNLKNRLLNKESACDLIQEGSDDATKIQQIEHCNRDQISRSSTQTKTNASNCFDLCAF